MHIALVSCARKHVTELGPALLSIATHAPHAQVTVFADAVGQQALRGCLEVLRALVSLQVLPISALGVDALPDYREGEFGRFPCASAKLLLQGAPAFARSRFVLALDVDMLVREPLSHLWDEWTAAMARAGTLWGMVPESTDRAYIGPPDNRGVPPPRAAGTSALYYNTGVVLIHAELLRARNLTSARALVSQVSAAVAGGRSYERFGLGDQNLLNAWISERPHTVTELPCRWNRRLIVSWGVETGPDPYRYNVCDDPAPGIRHANRMLGAGKSFIRGKQLTPEMMRQRLARWLPAASAPAAGAPTAAACRGVPALRANATALAACQELALHLVVLDEVTPWHERYNALPCAAKAARKAAKHIAAKVPRRADS